MKAIIKVLKVCYCTVAWMTLKLNNHDMIMVSFWKACIDLPDKSSSSEWMEWPKTFNELTGIKNPTITAASQVRITLVGFFIPVRSLKVFGHSIHSERRRIYLGKSIQALQNDTIIISWVFSFRVIQPTLPWHTFKTFMFVSINSWSS